MCNRIELKVALLIKITIVYILLREAVSLVSILKGTGSPYKVTTMLLTALPFCFYHISK